MPNGNGSAVALFVVCKECRSGFRLDESRIRGARGARVRCRKCGSFIDVRNPNYSPEQENGNSAPSPEPAPVEADAPKKEPVRESGTASKKQEGSFSTSEQKKMGWVSPTYSRSRAVALDTGKILENRCAAFHAYGPEVESYRMLRTNILQRTEVKGGTTVMVTSALPGEGKTLTSVNLALTFAKAFSQTVLLVDADLRQQRIYEVLGFKSGKGLVNYLLDGCPVSDLMVWPGIEKLTLISGGRTIAGSSELLGSPRMIKLVEEMKHRYPNRYVLFDVPPVLTGADAMAFAPLVDFIVLVVQAGKTSIQDVKKALAMLPKEKILGLVLNRHTAPVPTYPRKQQP
jgi:non-specific protein-tyrosine kinase